MIFTRFGVIPSCFRQLHLALVNCIRYYGFDHLISIHFCHPSGTSSSATLIISDVSGERIFVTFIIFISPFEKKASLPAFLKIFFIIIIRKNPNVINEDNIETNKKTGDIITSMKVYVSVRFMLVQGGCMLFFSKLFCLLS